MLREVAGKAHELVGQRDQALDHGIVSGEAGLADPLRGDLAAIPPREHRREPVDLRQVEPERLADVAHSAPRPVGDERCRERRAVAAVFPVHVLHDLLAPLMFEIDVDVGWFVALAA